MVARIRSSCVLTPSCTGQKYDVSFEISIRIASVEGI